MAIELSVVIPAYNEATRLPETLDALTAHFAPRGERVEILVVDDGSTDGTVQVAERRPVDDGSTDGTLQPADRRTVSRVCVSCIVLPENRGKGRAVVTGVAASRGDVVAFLDADLPYTLANLDYAVRLVASDEAEVALGARDLDASTYDPSYPLARQIAGRTYAALVRGVLGLPFGDTQCGLKCFRGTLARRLFPLLTIPGWGFDVELVYLACTRGHRIARFPVTLSHRHESRVRLVRDSLRMFGDLWRVRRNEARGLYGTRPAAGHRRGQPPDPAARRVVGG